MLVGGGRGARAAAAGLVANAAEVTVSRDGELAVDNAERHHMLAAHVMPAGIEQEHKVNNTEHRADTVAETYA